MATSNRLGRAGEQASTKLGRRRPASKVWNFFVKGTDENNKDSSCMPGLPEEAERLQLRRYVTPVAAQML
jgi:hypothetical protein